MALVYEHHDIADQGAGLLIGAIVLLIAVVLFVAYILPALRSNQTNSPEGDINVRIENPAQESSQPSAVPLPSILP